MTAPSRTVLASRPVEPYKVAMRAVTRALLACAALTACGVDDAVEGGPVLLVGIDGLEPSLVAELIEAGRLPNLARFANEGVLGRLETLDDTYSPVVWTTVATGQRTADHGIDFFFEPSSMRPYTSESRRVPALWNLVSDAGRSVDCVGWWVTWPAEPIQGRMLASYAAQAQAQVIWKSSYTDELREQTWPDDLWDVLREDVLFASQPESVWAELEGRFPLPEGPLGDPADTDRMTLDLAWTLAADRSNTRVTERFLGDAPADLVMTYLAVPDVAGHRFWRYHAPEEFAFEVNGPSVEAFGDWMALAYEDADAALGRMLEAIDERWTVVVVSDHGMHADPNTLETPETLQSGHHLDAPPGVVGILGPGIEPGGARLDVEPLGSVYDVAPFVLRRLGLARPEHWPAVEAGCRLDAFLSAAWSEEHPARTCPPPDRDWLSEHPRTHPPRIPNESSNEDFMRAFENLGYFER